MKTSFYDEKTRNICVIYRPQSEKVNFFVEEIQKALLFLRSLEDDSITFGDFNIDTLKTQTKRTKYENLPEPHISRNKAF